MSYRNPQIITPPNYGEIFARNMQYGAALVRSIAEPLLQKIQKQKDAIKFSKTAMFDTEVKIDDNVDTGNADIDDILQDYLIDDASGLAIISQKAYKGEDGVTQLDFKRAERTKIKEANKLNNIFERILKTKTALQPRRDNLSMYQSEKQGNFLGILDALDDIKKSGFYLVKDPESGETKIGHIKAFDKIENNKNGEFISYTLDELEEMMESGLSFKESFYEKSNPKNNESPTVKDILDLAVNTALGKNKDFFTEQRYGKIAPLNITENIKTIYGDKIDANGRLIPNNKNFGKFSTSIKTQEVQNYNEFAKITKSALDNNLPINRLDKIFDDEIIGRVQKNPVIIKDPQGKDVEISANAINVAKNLTAIYGLSSNEEDIYKLALDITSGRTNQKDGEYTKKVKSVIDSNINTKYDSGTYKAGQEFYLAKIVHEYTLNELTKMALENTFYNPSLEGFNFNSNKPTKINSGPIKDGKTAPDAEKPDKPRLGENYYNETIKTIDELPNSINPATFKLSSKKDYYLSTLFTDNLPERYVTSGEFDEEGDLVIVNEENNEQITIKENEPLSAVKAKLKTIASGRKQFFTP
jgi:hypothetical protein